LALPYLNAVLGGYESLKDPPAVIFRSQGKLTTPHGKAIAINALRDEAEMAYFPPFCGVHQVTVSWD
jgi:hypothetical protein